MTDQEFAVAIDYNALTKAQLLIIAGVLADRVESSPVSFQRALQTGALSHKQAWVAEAVRAVRGDVWAEAAALTVNIDKDAITIAGQVKDWLALNKGSTEVQVRAAFPALDDTMWAEIKRYLINAKLVRQSLTV